MQVQKKTQMLIEQTDFLLEKQRDALKTTEVLFTGFMKDVQAKSNQKGLSSEDLKSLKKIETLLVEKLSTISEDMMTDIEFLEKQLESLKAVAATKDEAKAKTMLDMMLDENDEIVDTATFKASVAEDAEIAKQDLVSVINDLKDALNENNIRDVELLLEALGSEEEIEIDFEDDGEEDEDEEDFEDDEEDGCGSCKHSCCQSERKNKEIFKGCCQSDDDDDNCCGKIKKNRK